MNVKERLKIFIKYMNISISTFEESISVANGYVNSISKSIGIDKLSTILEKYPTLNIEWLLTGNGEMIKSNPYHIAEVSNMVSEPERKPPDKDQMIIELQQHRIQSLEKYLQEQQQEIERLKKELKTTYDRSVVH